MIMEFQYASWGGSLIGSCTGLRHGVVLLSRAAADANRAHHLALPHQGYSPRKDRTVEAYFEPLLLGSMFSASAAPPAERLRMASHTRRGEALGLAVPMCPPLLTSSWKCSSSQALNRLLDHVGCTCMARGQSSRDTLVEPPDCCGSTSIIVREHCERTSVLHRKTTGDGVVP